MFTLEDRLALVTGATGGLGEAIARAYHAQGATITITGRREERLKALKADLGGERVHCIVADLGREEDVTSLIERAQEKMGGLCTLVNNAGMTRDGLSMRMKTEDFDEVIRVNLHAPFILARDSLKTMMRQRFGRIINLTSVVGVTGNPGQVNYCAAKAGLIGFAKSMASEVASRGITINCIAPGFIATDMTNVLKEEYKEKLAASIPAKHIGDPQDIAAAAVYLASREAGYVTGQTLHVNGGMAMI